MSTLQFALSDLSNCMFRVSHLSQGFVKKNGVKTAIPLTDSDTGRLTWWVALKAFPLNTTGGEDVELFAKCLSDTEPLALGSGEKPLVTLAGPTVELTDRGFSLVISGLKRVSEPKVGK